MSDINQEVLETFIVEAQDNLSEFENDMLAIEESDGDMEVVNKVFRGIHSIKGTAGFCGLVRIGELAHEMENVLNMIRNDELEITQSITETLLSGGDLLANMVDDALNSNDTDVSSLVTTLKAIAEGESAQAPTGETICNGDEADLEAVSEQEVSLDFVDLELPDGTLAFLMIDSANLIEEQNRGKHIYVCNLDVVNDLAEGWALEDFLGEITTHGNLVESYLNTAGVGDLSQDLPEAMYFVALIASSLPLEELAADLKVSDTVFAQAATNEMTIWSATGPKKPEAKVEKQPQKAKVEEAEQVEDTKKVKEPKQEEAAREEAADAVIRRASAATQPTSLRVDVRTLDVLMNLAGELVLSRNQLLQASSNNPDDTELLSVSAKIDRVTSELQDAIVQTRMQPIGTVFNKFPRIVRDLANMVGKKCDLNIEGKDVELDKSIIESIADPLTHLIRNSIDHGIESPEDRGDKSKAGTVDLKAFHRSGKVIIEIQDDGRGIDHNRLKDKAVDKGLITQDQARNMSDREAVKLIFHPGFSTAEKVTDISGRGVGMDVVRTNIERLGGTIDIETVIGEGTVIRIQLPLTLAIIPSLVVQASRQRFAIAQSSIRELIRVRREDMEDRVQKIQGAQVLRLRGTLLPLVHLNDVVSKRHVHVDNQSEQGSNEPINVVVLDAGELHYGLVVDGLEDSQEIVVKPLGRHMANAEVLAGATVLGDGRVASILDVGGVASFFNIRSIEHVEEEVVEDHNTTQKVLIFENAGSELFGVPEALVQRVERIEINQLDSIGGMEVLQYRGTSMSILRLEKLIRAEAPEELDSVYVIVYKVEGRDIGLIAPQLRDIWELSTDIDTQTFVETGVLGSLVHQEQTIRFLDLIHLTQKAHPEWFKPVEKTGPVAMVTNSDGQISVTTQSAGKPVILLAEDSGFFRKQVESFLVTDGYEVIGCEDGQIAWEKACEPDLHLDLIITDIEMPNMDGLEFTRNLRSHENLQHLPIVALTSLAREEDVNAGYEAGVNEYHIKMDRDRLLGAVSRLLKESRMNNQNNQNNQNQGLENAA